MGGLHRTERPAVQMEVTGRLAAASCGFLPLDGDLGRSPWLHPDLERKTEPEDSVPQLQAGHSVRNSSGLYRKEHTVREGAGQWGRVGEPSGLLGDPQGSAEPKGRGSSQAPVGHQAYWDALERL